MSVMSDSRINPKPSAALPQATCSEKPHMWVNKIGGTVEICLENVHYYAEWIKGEGADIAIWRAIDDNRIVGATLPYSPNNQ